MLPQAGKAPFAKEQRRATYDAILADEPRMLLTMTAEAESFIRAALVSFMRLFILQSSPFSFGAVIPSSLPPLLFPRQVKDPLKRPSIEELARHPWIAHYCGGGQSRKSLSKLCQARLIPRVHSFKAGARLVADVGETVTGLRRLSLPPSAPGGALVAPLHSQGSGPRAGGLSSEVQGPESLPGAVADNLRPLQHARSSISDLAAR